MKAPTKSKISDLIEFDAKHGLCIIGTDEAGRGPLAGPVVAAAVYFGDLTDEIIETIKFIDDSKKFSSKQTLRKELAGQVKKVSLYSISEASVEEIEKYNILQASLLAMRRACEDVWSQIEDKSTDIMILVDGKFVIPNYKVKQTAVKKGDSISASIAAASIIAKVYRDELMENIGQDYPCYNWHKNKGYPTKVHIEAIKTHGHCKWHRQSFLKKILQK